MISIKGFSEKQAVIADLVWALDSKEQVDNFISSLAKEDAKEAKVVVEMILAALFDDIENTDLACDILNSIKRKKNLG